MELANVSSNLSDRLDFLTTQIRKALLLLFRRNNAADAADVFKAALSAAIPWGDDFAGPEARFWNSVISSGLIAAEVASLRWSERALKGYRDTIAELDQIQPSASLREQWLRSRFALFAARRAEGEKAYAEARDLMAGNVDFLQSHSAGTESDARRIAYAKGDLPWKLLVDKNSPEALKVAEEAANLAQRNQIKKVNFVFLNLAHALLMNGKFDEARRIYKEFSDREISIDFLDLRQAGICNAGMEMI
jgi:pentatricopeptide repeat protein